jgi:alkaline phosphatase D
MKINLPATLLSIFGLILVQTVCSAQIDTSLAPFYHGVASGDPGSARVFLWTRVTPPAGTVSDIQVTWRVATDTGFVNIVKTGTVKARSSADYTVKATVTGLQANKWYYYQFTALGKNSLTGRTRTLPTTGVDSIRFAVLSCSNYQSGYYNVYKSLADRNDIDVIIHLGDYLYEYGVGGFGYDATLGRDHDPANECLTLSDYRKRHAQTKLDEDSRRMLQQYPLIAVWDDHEVANDAWIGGAENHDPATEGSWANRLADARKAYFEWMPVSKPDPNGDPNRLYRQFKFGNLIRLDMLDTRLQGRTEQLPTSSPSFNDTARTILGIDQRNWLFNDLNVSSSKWNIIGQQVMVSPLTVFGGVLNVDQWDGYPAERARLYANLDINKAKNLVVLTGDIHSAWANDLPLSGYGVFNRSKSAGVEFVCPSVTSPNPLSNISPSLVQLFNNHVRYVDLAYNGYTIIDVNKNRLQGDFYAVSSIKSKTFSTIHKQSWFVNDKEKFVRQTGNPSTRLPNRIAIPAPTTPQPVSPRLASELAINSLDIYPVPANDRIYIQQIEELSPESVVEITDLNGKSVVSKISISGILSSGFSGINVSNLNPGLYIIRIINQEGIYTGKIIKL